MAMTTRTLQRAIKYFKEGHSVKETADHIGVHESTMYRQFYKFNVLEKDEERIRKHTPKLTDEQREQLLNDYKEGYPIADLSEKYGISYNSIYYIINKKSKPRQRIDEDKVKKAIKMYNSKKYSIDEILKATDISRATLFRKVKEYKKER